MARYNRINLDGKSITETYLAATDIEAGVVVVENNGEFAKASAGAVGRIFVATTGMQQGLGTGAETPEGDSLAGEYAEEGRELAILLGKNNTVTKGAPLSVAANGLLALNADGKNIIGYAQEDLAVGNTSADTPELLRVRIRNVTSNGLGE